MVRMLTLDPGLETGWSLWHGPQLVAQGTIGRGVDGFIDWWFLAAPDHNVLVYEDFIVDPSFVGRSWSSEVIGAAKALSPGKKVSQKRSDKATLFSQKNLGDKGETERFEWLRAKGFSGVGHELDAITHGLVYLKRQRNAVVLKKYWAV